MFSITAKDLFSIFFEDGVHNFLEVYMGKYVFSITAKYLFSIFLEGGVHNHEFVAKRLGGR